VKGESYGACSRKVGDPVELTPVPGLAEMADLVGRIAAEQEAARTAGAAGGAAAVAVAPPQVPPGGPPGGPPAAVAVAAPQVPPGGPPAAAVAAGEPGGEEQGQQQMEVDDKAA